MIEPGTPRDKQWLEECCNLIVAKLPDNYTFAVFAFPTSGTDRIFYASSATRESIMEAISAWLAYAKSASDYGKHAPDRQLTVEQYQDIAKGLVDVAMAVSALHDPLYAVGLHCQSSYIKLAEAVDGIRETLREHQPR